MAGRLDQIAVLLVTLCMAVWCSTITPQPPEQQGVKEFGLSTQKSAQDHSSVLETTVHPEVLGSEGSQPLTTSKISFSNNRSQAGPPGSVADFKPHMPEILRISSVSINALSSDENQDGSARVVGNASANPGNSWSHSPASSMNSSSSNQDLGIGGSQGQTGEDNGAHLGNGRQKNTKCNPCTSSQDKCQTGEVCETDDNCLKWCRKPDGSSIPLESYGKKTTSEDIGFFRSGKQEKTKEGAGRFKSFLTKNKLFSLIASSGKEAKDVGKKSHTCDDQCNIFSSRCKEGTMCVTITTETGCDMKCRAPDGSETDLGSHISTAPPTTLRPLSERRCEISGKECTHGTCKNGLNCTCDRGYKGELCSKQECYECSHGVCYFKSPRVMACDCDPGWGGPFCHEPYCSRKCKNGGSCMWDVKPKPSMICTCRDPWIGDYCERMKPKPSNSNTLALAVGIATPVVCIIALLISWYILWRKRVIFVFKVVNMFKAYEDDDDKVYDAYVSLTESDTDYVFVKHVLQPKLEDMGHRLYLHARDGSAGVKSEEILKAVEMSRRCIMLLTSDYINNEWCRFEYLIAQHETCIKLKQRIIPIVMDDIDKDKKKMDKTLRFIVDSVKCLRYPIPPPELSDGQFSPIDLESGHPKSKELATFERRQARFWERLRLSMPKKRASFEVTSPTLSCNSQCPLSEHVHYNNKKGVRLFLDSFVSIFPFRRSSNNPANSFTLATQCSTCENAEEKPSVSVISPTSPGDREVGSYYQCILNESESKTKSENDLNEGNSHSHHKDRPSVIPLRLEIQS